MFYKQIVILEDGADIDSLDGSRQFFNYSFSKAVKVFREECPGGDGLALGYDGEFWTFLGRISNIIV